MKRDLPSVEERYRRFLHMVIDEVDPKQLLIIAKVQVRLLSDTHDC